MAYNFLAWEHDQAFLLPPDIREWLPADHEVWALLEAAELLDFSAFVARRRPDGWGRAAYHPAMMALLLLYAYAVGERSSRQIERRCRQDVAFRVLCANQTPDHATIARFRTDHEAELLGLHVQVVSLCAAAGMVSVGLVALDSTKMAADASTKALRRHATITAELEAMYAEAAATDAAEDAQAATSDKQAPGRLPRQLAEAARRRERFQQAARQIEERVAAEQAAFDAVQARQQAREAAGRPRRGRPRHDPPLRPEPEGRRANTTDPDSRMLRKPGGFVQGYSGQLAVSADGIVLAFDVDARQNDAHQLHPMLDAAQAALAAAGIQAPIGVLVADKGYYSDDNVTAAGDDDPELLVATVASSKLASDELDPRQLTIRSPIARQMTDRLRSEEGRALYARRACTVEPHFGDAKHNKGFDRFSRRGRRACQAEWGLHHIACNLQRWARRRRLPPTTGPTDPPAPPSPGDRPRSRPRPSHGSPHGPPRTDEPALD